MALATPSFCDGEEVFSAIQPIRSRPKFCVSLKYSYCGTHEIGVDVGLARPDGAHDRQIPGTRAVLCVKMLLMIGTRSPTFQPHFFSMASPTRTPVRSRMNAWRASAATSIWSW